MRKSGMTREEAIKRFGIDTVEKLENENCDFTNRVDNCLDLENVYEFAASVEAREVDENGMTGDLCVLTAYYYADKDAVDDCDGDLGLLDWEIHTYVAE